tara:strand:+ start:671 stop:1291 length:621 start_codon:yes stop_codon:yes gene_type:complete
MKMNIGIFGGTFDPIHLGHIAVAKYAKTDLNLDKVIFVPAGCPQLKPSLPAASAKHRFEMVKLAIGNKEMFYASDIEIKRKGPTFTVDTLKSIKKNYHSKSSLWFIVGSDAFSEFNKWENYQEIMELSNVCVVRRPGESTELEQFGHVKKLVTENNVVFINRITPQISSTNVKAIIKDKNKVKRYLSPEVRDYIVRNGLYRTDEDK